MKRVLPPPHSPHHSMLPPWHWGWSRGSDHYPCTAAFLSKTLYSSLSLSKNRETKGGLQGPRVSRKMRGSLFLCENEDCASVFHMQILGHFIHLLFTLIYYLLWSWYITYLSPMGILGLLPLSNTIVTWFFFSPLDKKTTATELKWIPCMYICISMTYTKCEQWLLRQAALRKPYPILYHVLLNCCLFLRTHMYCFVIF